MAEKSGRDNRKSERPVRPQREREAFATAIARAELGRFYWSERSERELQEARRKRLPKGKA